MKSKSPTLKAVVIDLDYFTTDFSASTNLLVDNRSTCNRFDAHATPRCIEGDATAMHLWIMSLLSQTVDAITDEDNGLFKQLHDIEDALKDKRLDAHDRISNALLGLSLLRRDLRDLKDVYL